MDEPYTQIMTDAYIDELLSSVNEKDLATVTCQEVHDQARRETWGIVGYRNYNDWEAFCRTMDEMVVKYGEPVGGVSGGATGVDTMAKKWCDMKKIPFREHLPKTMSARALLDRNVLIVADADRIIAFLSPRTRSE